MTALIWPIKRSLIGYVESMSDGSITLETATETGQGFRFPLVTRTDDELQFEGSVAFAGHHGMMRVTIAEPRITRTAKGWSLSIADPDAPETRLTFGRIVAFDGAETAGITLTQDGADLFFGPYREGTPLDDAILVD